MEGDFSFLKKQLLFTLFAWLVFFALAFTPWKYNRYIGIVLWTFSILALILTLFPQTSISAGGARRWIELPFSFRFQPSELLKVTTPFLLAWLLVLKKKWALQKVVFWLVPLLALALPIGILILQPDFGTVILLFSLVFAFIFVLGFPWPLLSYKSYFRTWAILLFCYKSILPFCKVGSFFKSMGRPFRKRISSDTKPPGYSFRGTLWCWLGQRAKQVVFPP